MTLLIPPFDITKPIDRMVAADWCDEQGDEMTAGWLRFWGHLPPRLDGRGGGGGSGSGSGGRHRQAALGAGGHDQWPHAAECRSCRLGSRCTGGFCLCLSFFSPETQPTES